MPSHWNCTLPIYQIFYGQASSQVAMICNCYFSTESLLDSRAHLLPRGGRRWYSEDSDPCQLYYGVWLLICSQSRSSHRAPEKGCKRPRGRPEVRTSLRFRLELSLSHGSSCGGLGRQPGGPVGRGWESFSRAGPSHYPASFLPLAQCPSPKPPQPSKLTLLSSWKRTPSNLLILVNNCFSPPSPSSQ